MFKTIYQLLEDHYVGKVVAFYIEEEKNNKDGKITLEVSYRQDHNPMYKDPQLEWKNNDFTTYRDVLTHDYVVKFDPVPDKHIIGRLTTKKGYVLRLWIDTAYEVVKNGKRLVKAGKVPLNTKAACLIPDFRLVNVLAYSVVNSRSYDFTLEELLAAGRNDYPGARRLGKVSKKFLDEMVKNAGYPNYRIN